MAFVAEFTNSADVSIFENEIARPVANTSAKNIFWPPAVLFSVYFFLFFLDSGDTTNCNRADTINPIAHHGICHEPSVRSPPWFSISYFNTVETKRTA
jgi:hypothetical protein